VFTEKFDGPVGIDTIWPPAIRDVLFALGKFAKLLLQVLDGH
jgi:hypothetical protein